MIEFDYMSYIEKLKMLLSIDSVTGSHEEIQTFLIEECDKMGYKYQLLHKGGVVVDLGGEGNTLTVMAHADTIGLMVRHINSDGTLKVVPIGGLRAYNAERENVRVQTRKGDCFTGVVRRKSPSVHVTSQSEQDTIADYDKNLVVLLDVDVHNKDEVMNLGICVGDFIALEPRMCLEKDYIKSHYLDDKALVALLLMAMESIKVNNLHLTRNVKFYFTMYEEIGHGGSWLPEQTKDIIALDVMCTGPEQTSDERKVTILAKDSRYPYHLGLLRELVECGSKGIDYVVDVFTPSYGTDCDTALSAGYDVRHAAIGPGTVATHGYERMHKDGLIQTYKLLLTYII